MWKKIGIGFALLLVVIAGTGWFLFANLDHYIKTAIEKYGSAATQAAVTVDAVSLSLTSGQGSISGLIVGNPSGFYTPYALSLGTILIHIDTASLTGTGPIIIDEIDINQPNVIYEVNGGGKGLSLSSLNFNSHSNLAALQAHVEAYAGGGGPNSSANAPQRKEIIRDLYVNGGKVSVSASLLQGKRLTVPLPAIHLTGIGQTTGGATAAQAGEQILSAITTKAALAGAASLMKDVGSAATGPLGGAVTNKVKSLF